MNSTSGFAAHIVALQAMPLAGYDSVVDGDLLALSREAAQVRQLVDAHLTAIAGELARRSARELGGEGLAQRLGLRTVEELVRVTNRSTARDAGAAVRVGRMLATRDEPWLAPVSRSIIEEGLPVASADAIRSGLGAPSAAVSEAKLTDAAARLCADGAALDPDRLQRRARELRDELDLAGVAAREAALRDQRSLRVTKLANGLTRAVWTMDPETAAEFADVYDRATSPRRGGPRFVGDDDRRAAELILADERTTDQLASDVFLHLLRQGADADSSELLGSGGARISVHVTGAALATGVGAGHIEGQSSSVSLETVERLSCSGSVTEISFGADGQALDVGREQRLYTPRQRRALAARDGGCRAPGCDRPPSWTEAHHINHWVRDRGRTDIADGILLCRHHHLLFHNNGWEIERVGPAYWLVPPVSVDPGQRRILLEAKSPLHRQGAA